MLNHFIREMERLTCEILKLAASVEEMILIATQALCDGRRDLAEQVVNGDATIDDWEVRIEEECLKILALHQPVAADLRRVTAVLKINNDLERMADLAVNIAERALYLDENCPGAIIPEKLEAMTTAAVKMVRGSLDAFVNLDACKARAVCAYDDEVDRLNREIIAELKESLRSYPERLEAGFELFSATRHLERIADHATNIAEDVVYMKEGAIIRHHYGDPQRVTRKHV